MRTIATMVLLATSGAVLLTAHLLMAADNFFVNKCPLCGAVFDGTPGEHHQPPCERKKETKEKCPRCGVVIDGRSEHKWPCVVEKDQCAQCGGRNGNHNSNCPVQKAAEKERKDAQERQAAEERRRADEAAKRMAEEANRRMQAKLEENQRKTAAAIAEAKQKAAREQEKVNAAMRDQIERAKRENRAGGSATLKGDKTSLQALRDKLFAEIAQLKQAIREARSESDAFRPRRTEKEIVGEVVKILETMNLSTYVEGQGIAGAIEQVKLIDPQKGARVEALVAEWHAIAARNQGQDSGAASDQPPRVRSETTDRLETQLSEKQQALQRIDGQIAQSKVVSDKTRALFDSLGPPPAMNTGSSSLRPERAHDDSRDNSPNGEWEKKRDEAKDNWTAKGYRGQAADFMKMTAAERKSGIGDDRASTIDTKLNALQSLKEEFRWEEKQLGRDRPASKEAVGQLIEAIDERAAFLQDIRKTPHPVDVVKRLDTLNDPFASPVPSGVDRWRPDEKKN